MKSEDFGYCLMYMYMLLTVVWPVPPQFSGGREDAGLLLFSHLILCRGVCNEFGDDLRGLLPFP